MKFSKENKMRLFVYKTLFIFVCVLILYKLTLGNLISNLEDKILNLSTKENAIAIKEKIRQEIKGSLKKEKILNEEDAVLLNKFFNKIKKEIEAAD